MSTICFIGSKDNFVRTESEYNINPFSGDRFYMSESDARRRLILTYKDVPALKELIYL